MVDFQCTRQLAPECFTGWLGDVVDVFQEDTEWSLELIFGCAAVELGLAIGRKAFVYYFGNLYPNLYTIALGKPGEAHKTHIAAAVAMLGKRADSHAPQPVRRFSISSAEGVLEQFCEKVAVTTESTTGNRKPKTTMQLQPIPGQRCLIDESEFTSVLKKSRRTATGNIPETLRTLWDGESKRYPTRTDSIEIEEPFCSLISATTPDALEQTMTSEDIADGTMPRCIFMFCTKREPVSYNAPFRGEDIGRLVDQLTAIRTFAGEHINGYVPLSNEALAEWDSYYKALKRYTDTVSELAAHMLNRIHTMAMKFALLYAIQAEHNAIELEDMRLALHVANYLAFTATTITGQTHKHPIAKEEERILNALERKYPAVVPYRDIVAFLKGKIAGDTLKRMLTAMSDGGLLEESANVRGTRFYRFIPPDDVKAGTNHHKRGGL